MDNVAYLLSRSHGPRPLVSGIQIGRFAVRRKLSDDPDRYTDGRTCRGHSVDHIGTGACVGHFTSFEDATAFADDVSRFAAHDASCRGDFNDPTVKQRLFDQVGASLLEWIFDCDDADRHIPYREWLAARRQAA